MDELIFTPTDFVAVLNQTLEYAYPSAIIVGELANLRVSKGRWVYFDLKDDTASVKFFATVQQLPGPLEDGMLVQVRGLPRLHQLYGFSVNVQFIQPVGEGSIKKAAALLEAKLKAEGLFDESRKRPLPYPPERVGLIASEESAAYRDFVKIIDERWGGLSIELANIQVQGEPAIGQIIRAIEYFNERSEPVDVLVLTRGGGSPEDLAAFSSEQVTRAVAASRIPTMVAIGHEIDISLAELAADRRASTPSNAAQMLVPDRAQTILALHATNKSITQQLVGLFRDNHQQLNQNQKNLTQMVQQQLEGAKQSLRLRSELLMALSPEAALRRGYSVVRHNGVVVRKASQVTAGDLLTIQLQQGQVSATVSSQRGKS